jgi:hypothetical protein
MESAAVSSARAGSATASASATSSLLEDKFREAILFPLTDGFKKIKLGFTYNGIPFTTEFNVLRAKIPESSTYDSLVTKIENGCVEIGFTINNIPKIQKEENKKMNNEVKELTAFALESEISGNTSEKKCFSPILEKSERIKQTDVLQVLKTKLARLVPLREPITLVDIMTVRDVYVSTNKILRGGDGVYERYGYVGIPQLYALKEFIRTLEWKDLPSDLQEFILPHLPGGVPDGSTKFTESMKLIPDTVFQRDGMPSTDLFSKIARFFRKDIAPMRYTNYIFNPSSPRWLEWDATLVFTHVSEPELVAGGRRKTRRTRRTRRMRRTR